MPCDKKIVLVGAGSQAFGMKTMTALIWELGTFDGATICLHDINEKELQRTKALADIAVTQLAEVPADEEDMPHGTFTIESTLDRKEAFQNADFIVSSIEVNRYPLWKMDYEVPVALGSTQIYGENGGSGGFFHACRVAPIVVEIAQDAYDICPNAFFFNYTNPMIRVTTAVHRAVPKLRTIGLCHEFLGMRGRVLRMWRKELGPLVRENFEDELEMVTAGLNHFAFVQKLVRTTTGEDLLPELPGRMHAMFDEEQPLNMYLLDHFGQAAYTEDSHSGEYIPWARALSNVYGYNWDEHQRSDAQHREDFTQNLNRGTNFFWWLERSGERVVNIMKGILNDSGYLEGAVNILNADGLLPFLPGGIAVEV
ncbi:MAG TPA: hypothetical protein VKK79_18175, partial [Candidatus Lokiarchaeia archaeon]|nr:hypothetical protein [Candidatus Lokiarchaeia archaeon]